MSEKKARDEACKLFKKECGMHYALRTAYVKGYSSGSGELAKSMLIESLTKRIQDAEKVIDYYADKENYGHMVEGKSQHDGFDCYDIILFDFSQSDTTLCRRYGGNRAREYQKTYGVKP